jgi:hypothetical protein
MNSRIFKGDQFVSPLASLSLRWMIVPATGWTARLEIILRFEMFAAV